MSNDNHYVSLRNMWFKGLLIGFLAYVVIKFITRVILPFRKIKKDFEEQVRQAQRPADGREEGEIRVEKKEASNRSVSKATDDDYVDFEEVE